MFPINLHFHWVYRTKINNAQKKLITPTRCALPVTQKNYFSRCIYSGFLIGGMFDDFSLLKNVAWASMHYNILCAVLDTNVTNAH